MSAAYRKGPSSTQRKSTAAICLARYRNAAGVQPKQTAEFSLRQRRVSRQRRQGLLSERLPRQGFRDDGRRRRQLQALDSTYGRDKSTVFVNGYQLTDADAGSFELLDRPSFAKDSHHVYQHDRVISDDPAHFVLLDGDLAKDSHVVFWSDGSVLSNDPEHLLIISAADHYLVHQGRPDCSCQRQPDRRRRSGDNPNPARRLRTRRSTHLLLHRPNRRCGSVVLPATRRPVRKRLRTRLLDGQDHRRRGSERLSAC